jgi:hypothetical protein
MPDVPNVHARQTDATSEMQVQPTPATAPQKVPQRRHEIDRPPKTHPAFQSSLSVRAQRFFSSMPRVIKQRYPQTCPRKRGEEEGKELAALQGP